LEPNAELGIRFHYSRKPVSAACDYRGRESISSEAGHERPYLHDALFNIQFHSGLRRNETSGVGRGVGRALIMALFYDLATEKDFKIPTQPERRERALRGLIKKRQKRPQAAN
jgi:hypothetical protein